MRTIALWAALSLIAGPSHPEQLPPNFEQQVDAIFADYEGAQPGCAVGVYRSGNLVFGKGYGLADLSTREDITTSTVFDVASLSKQFTAFAIALLEREGRITLDSEVQIYVPELPQFQAPITIRHLVHHTSGLRDYGSLLELTGWRFDQPLSRSEALAWIPRQRELNFAPGTRHEYSNSNYLRLALIVERVTGQSLAQFGEERMFRPLGMSRTEFRDDPDGPRPARATNYTRRADGQWTANHVWDRVPPGSGGLHTSIEDLGKWDRNFVDPNVGDAALIRTITSPATLGTGERLDYGYGLYLSPYRGLQTVSHSGRGGGTFFLMRLPERQLSVATLCNRYSLGPHATDSAVLTFAVFDLLLDRSSDGVMTSAADLAPEIPLPTERLATYVGDYWLDAGAPIRLRLQEGRLVELLEGGKVDPLIPVAIGRFRSPDGKSTYEFSGEDDQVLKYEESANDYAVTGERRPAWVRSSVDLTEAAGRYCTAEVPVCWSLVSNGTSLTLRRPGFPDRVLEPAWRDTFTLVDTDDIGTRTMRLGLRRASDQTITGFNLSRARITGLLFERL